MYILLAPVCSLQWNPTGTTVAGDGTAGVGAQQLNLPTDVFLASANTLLIVCTGASRVQRWTIGATQGVTVAGQADGSAGGNPNQFSNPTGVVVDRNGNIYVTDTGRSRIQRWPPGAAEGQTIAAAGDSTSANFIAAGTYYYGCNYHPGMGATIIVFRSSTGSSSSSANSLTGSSSMLVSNARMGVGHQ
ncbi:unnamed protein product [Rotaria sordida]|uniref:Uncharacterized protein n=1 Tax=Rotaria sordida TaxID=392033 RepID=A0A814HTC1_9BILA|nr:unnamed protein product [Rotaria sordida]